MHDDQIDDLLHEAAQSYNDPPALDRERVWSAIEARHFDTRAVTTPWWANSWIRVAAALVLGAGIGRISVSGTTPATAPDAVNTVAQTEAVDSVPTLHTMSEPAKLRYLGQTVALLASVQGDAIPSRNDVAVSKRASDLLLTTRLLLDSPSAADPAVRGLLEDLELVLVQIVQMPPKRNASDVDLIKEAMEQREVMPRLIAAVSNSTSAE